MLMVSGFPPCEGQGPELSAVFIDTPITGPPVVISINGQKGYLIPYSGGCLLLTDTDGGQNASIRFSQLVPQIAAGCVADFGADDTWQVTALTSASFRLWVDEVIALWRSGLQLRLQQGVLERNATLIKEAVDAGADVNVEMPNGELPLVTATRLNSTLVVSALFNYGRVSTDHQSAAMAYARDNSDAATIAAMARPAPVGAD